MHYEITFALIKPDAVRNNNVGEIITEMEREFHVADVHCAQWHRALAATFYEEHCGKPFFDDLVDFMCCDRLYMITLVSVNAVQKWREMMGATDPKAAAPDTIRGRFGSKTGPIMHNAVHGSASIKEMARETTLIRTHLVPKHPKMNVFGDQAVRLDKGYALHEMP
jgi:nucleoside-diphosphate kinase